MKRQDNRQDRLRQRVNGASRQRPSVPPRGQLHRFFFRLGPVTLSICSVLLISLMAILYLSQQGQAVTTNQQIQNLRAQQTELQRQNDDLVNTIASEQSSAYIAAHASSLGLTPAGTQNVQVIVIPNVKVQQNGDQSEP
jgi:cell division protein FtsL